MKLSCALTKRAYELSKDALTLDDHTVALETHKAAERAHRKEGNKDAAFHHGLAGVRHRQAARARKTGAFQVAVEFEAVARTAAEHALEAVQCPTCKGSKTLCTDACRVAACAEAGAILFGSVCECAEYHPAPSGLRCAVCGKNLI